MLIKRALALTVAALVFAACTAMQQQKSQIRADEGVFKNLQVFPQNITHDELISAMRGFTRGLGTRCDHCHVPNPPGSEEQFNFASDKKPEKNVARQMLRMTRDINANYVTKVNEHGSTVTCWTCHHGQTVPPLPGPDKAVPAPETPIP